MLSSPLTTGGSHGRRSDLSHDDIFELLSNRRRRYVIHALKRSAEPLRISELSARVAAWEKGVDPEEVNYKHRRNVYTTLRRTHLPKLEAKDIVEIDEETSVVEPTPTLEDLDIYVEVLSTKEIPWSLYYIGLAGVALALLLAVATETPGFAALDPIDVGIFTATIFSVSSAAHYAIGRRARLGNTRKPPELRKRE